MVFELDVYGLVLAVRVMEGDYGVYAGMRTENGWERGGDY